MEFITTLGEYHLRLGYLPISFPRVIYLTPLWTQPSLYGYLAISLRQLTFAIEIAKTHQNVEKNKSLQCGYGFPVLLCKQHSFLVHLLWCKKYGYPSLPYLFISVFSFLIFLVYGHPFYLEWLLE